MKCSWTDYSEYDPDRGGPTPTVIFTMSKTQDGDDILGVEVQPCTYDVEDYMLPDDREAALQLLRSRLNGLRKKADQTEAMLVAAERTKHYELINDKED